jgi:uncharacterized protein (DUF433 family)
MSKANVEKRASTPPAPSSLAPEDWPRYTVKDAAHYLSMSPNTLRSWVAGRRYGNASGMQKVDPLIVRPVQGDPRLSFANLVEAFVLLALRQTFKVRMSAIRTALAHAEQLCKIPRLLLSRQLRAAPGNVFVKELDEIVNVGLGGQLAMPEIMERYLRRLEWNERDTPRLLYPFTRKETSGGPKVVAIDPEVAFGRPVVRRKWISTAVIAERFKAGESIQEIAEDYELEVREVEEAIRYETPAAA